MTFFVAGITGRVGGATARGLLERGHGVRALVRDLARASAWAQSGVDLRKGDLTDASAVAAALEGAEGAFLMLPPVLAPKPGFPEAKAIISSLVEALGQWPPERVVALSSFGSEQASGLGLITATHLLERALDGLPCPTAFLRAGSFLENYLAGLDGAAHTGVLHSFVVPVDRPEPMIATADIGKEAARLLDEGWSGRRIVEIGTPYSPNDVARAMGEVLGRAVEARAIPRERWTATLEAFGIAPGFTAAYEEMMDGVNSGWIAFGASDAVRVDGSTLPVQLFRRVREAAG
ncbi:MAG: NmrA family NAD(P)-binding protein [Acidobacteria bacterium]|nr:NmrA family NAD(P)-binding protein [Acidobacteriota bacterium]